MNTNLLILGAGTFGAVIKEIAEETGVFGKIDFLDDAFGTAECQGRYHEPSIGKLEDYQTFFPEYACAVVSIGDPEIRACWTKKLHDAGFTIPTIISPRAYVSESAQLGRGAVVGPMAVINPHAYVGTGTFVMACAVVDHNATLADYCNIQCGSVVRPCARLKSFTMTQPNEVAGKTGETSGAEDGTDTMQKEAES